MSRELYGISALDPKVAATNKFIQDKQIPPDKVEDFLLSMGADPKLASLVFKYRRVQEAAKQQQNQPPTASVDQEVSSQYAQLKQQERMGQGVASMPAPNLARAPMQGGITGQPMPQMAGGGIVAFDNGGDVPHWSTVEDDAKTSNETPRKKGVLRRIVGNPIVRRAGGLGLLATALGAFLGDDEPKAEGATVEQAEEGLTDEDMAILARDQAAQKEDTQVATPTKINLPAAPTFKRPDLTPFTEAIAEAEKRVPKDREAALAEEMAREEQLGETKVIEARGKELKAQREKAVTSPEKKFWLAFAQAGFAASAKGARDLWETLSIGGVEGIKAYESMKEKEQQLRERLQDKRFQLDDIEAQVKRGASKAGLDRLDKLRAEVTAAQGDLTRTKVAIGLAEQSEAGANFRAAAAQQGADRRARELAATRANKQKSEEDYYADIRAAQRTTNPNLKAAHLARAENTRLAKEKLEQAESSFLANEARLAAKREEYAAIMNRGEADDEFGNDVQQLN